MKRILSLIAACAMLLCNNINVFAANDGGTYNKKLYSDACGLINALNVGISVNENSADSDITRIELLKNACKVLSNGAQLENADNGTLALTDVAESDKGYLEYAAYCGLINYQDKYFYPDDAADFKFAERTLLCLISYYNDNTLNQLLKNDLSKGLRKSAATGFKAGDAYVMIYNLLMSKQPYGVFSGTPILQGLYDLERVKVRLIGDSLSSYSGRAADEGFVRVEYNNGAVEDLIYSGDTKELLGRYVYMFYNDKEGKIAFMTPFNTDDIKTEFGEKEFVAFDSDTRKMYHKEFKSSNRWEVSYVEKKDVISADADIIYNGVFAQDHSTVYDILNNNTKNIEKIQLISTDSSSKINLIKIDAYTTAYAENVSSEKYVIRDKSKNARITLDPDENINRITVENSEGDTISFDSISSGSVISVFEIPGQDKEYRLIVSTSKTDGTVSSITREDNRRIITADGIEYIFSNGLTDYADAMSMGSKYILYLDHNGFVAGYEFGSLGAENVGGVASVIYNEESEAFELRIFTIAGELKDFTTRADFRVNGAKARVNDDYTLVVRNDNDEDEKMTFAQFKNYLQKSLIQYKLDGYGKIRDIILPRKNAKEGNIGYTKGMNDPDATLENPANGRMRFKKNNNFFIPHEYAKVYNFTAVKPDTKVIKIPSAEFTYRESYFSLSSLDELRNDYQAPVLAYTFAGEDAIAADIIAIVHGGSSAPSGSVFYLVKKISEAINNEGEVGKLLQCVDVRSGADVEFTTESTDFPEYESSGSKGEPLPISVGDIIQIGTNAYGDAASFKLTYDCSEGKAQDVRPNSWYSEMRLVHASVYSVSGSYFTYVTGEIKDSPDVIQIGGCKSVFSVEKEDGKDNYEIKVGSTSSLVGYVEDPVNYSKIIYITVYGETIACVAYNN